MPSITRLSKFLKAEHIKDGDMITFIDAGTIVNKEFKKTNGESEYKDLLEITVDYKGERKTYTPNTTSIGLLTKGFGAETESWVGKSATLFIVPSPNNKLMIVAKPVLM